MKFIKCFPKTNTNETKTVLHFYNEFRVNQWIYFLQKRREFSYELSYISIEKTNNFYEILIKLRNGLTFKSLRIREKTIESKQLLYYSSYSEAFSSKKLAK